MTVTNVTPPVVTGTAKVGYTLSSTRGTWTSDDPLQYAYQWLRCDSAGANCNDIGGATNSQYTCASADIGSRLRSEVTVTEVPPPQTFGDLLPARIAESAGATTNVASLSALQSALSSVANGATINITASINGGGSTLNISRQATAAAPITITSNPGVVISNFSQIYIASAAYLRFRGLDVANALIDGIKLTSSAHDCEIDGCHIHGSQGQGILITASATNIQVWNNIINNNGSNQNLDHGVYWSYARSGDVLANNLIYDNWAYNVQIYPNCQNLIIACNTLDGGQVHANSRGGMVIGSEGTPQTGGTINVGLLTTNAPTAYGVHVNTPLAANNNFYDSLGFGNAGGDFQTASNMTYTNCTHANPLYVNRAAQNYHLQGGSPAIDLVDASRYGYVPPTDIEGSTRVTADAGCYAA